MRQLMMAAMAVAAALLTSVQAQTPKPKPAFPAFPGQARGHVEEQPFLLVRGDQHVANATCWRAGAQEQRPGLRRFNGSVARRRRPAGQIAGRPPAPPIRWHHGW